MSLYSTASAAMEHDTARRLQALDPSGHDRLARRLSDIRLDHGRLDHSRVENDRLIVDHALSAAVADGSPGGVTDEDLEPGISTPVPQAALDPAREALGRTCLTVKRIAQDIGMPRATLEAYRLGTRRMPHTARIRLGTYLAAHAAMLDGLAQALIVPSSTAPSSTAPSSTGSSSAADL